MQCSSLGYVDTKSAYTIAYMEGVTVPKLDKRLTDTLAKKLPIPSSPYEIFWCGDDPGFGCRVTSAGSRAWVMERRVDRKTVRRTLGKVTGANGITAEVARKLKINVSSELQQGVDRSADSREAVKTEKKHALTLAQALRDYVDKKRRAKDGLALKDRTKADYLAMIEEGKTRQDGSQMAGGELFPLAQRSIHKIAGADIRHLHAALMKRGARRATYAMQVLRAVMNWQGVTVPDNPLGKEVAGRDRIVLASTAGRPKPIPPEYLGAWWRAACAIGDEAEGLRLASDYYRFRLLTGCRGVEILGDDHGNEPIRVQDVDVVGARIHLPDTKNRTDHVLLLSKQALEIVKRNVEGRAPGDRLFALGDPRKTLRAINVAAGMAPLACQGHGLRATFASVAEELVSQYTLKRMMNHADSGDVTGSHYIGKGEAQLRAGWQVVADFIESQAGSSS